MWTQTIGNVTIECKSKDNKFSEWEKLEQAWKDKLTEAVKMAPKMVEDAIAALNGLSSAFLPQRRGRQWRSEAFQNSGPDRVANNPGVPNFDYTEVGQGLAKYFNLTSLDSQYWRYVNGIRGTFTIVLTNLRKPYTLQINAELGDVKRGQVLASYSWSGAQIVGPLRQRFGFQDEWDHKMWLPLTQGDIEISPVWVEKAPAAREVARTIVHEASHKWAFTTDVLYKQESFAGGRNDKELPVHPQRKNPTADAPVHPSQAKLVIPGRPRFFLPMMGFEGKDDPDDHDEPDVLITTERWLENADSYAWFARRMFKRRSVTF